MGLILTFAAILSDWRGAFTKEQAFKRAKQHAYAAICCFGRRTITNFIILMRRDQQDHSADYRVYSKYKWNVSDLFDPILRRCLGYFPGKYIVVGADDTTIRKTGKKIPFTGWRRDPLGPAFQTNLIWGLRFLQFSVLLPVYSFVDEINSARAIPIRFLSAPSLKKPGKKAPKADHDEYKKKSKVVNLSSFFVEGVKQLRESLDHIGMSTKVLLMVVDGSFCNGACFGTCIPGVHMLGRARKNIRLCMKAAIQGRRFYSADTFTPEEFRQANQENYKKGVFHFGGRKREIRYAEIKDVYWRTVTKRRPLRLIIVAPIPYSCGGRKYYRAPGYLLCTDLEADIHFLIQSYLDRWQIEVNFRDQKTSLGVGEAQVWNETSVEKQPGFVVACYAMLLLAGVISQNDLYRGSNGIEPKWRSPPKRLSIRHLKGELRKNLINNPEVIPELDLGPVEIATILQKAA